MSHDTADSSTSSAPTTTFTPVQPAPLIHLGHPEHIPMYEMPTEASKVVPHKWILILTPVALAIAFLGHWFTTIGETAKTPDVPLPWVLPFVLLLACIATMPFIAKHFWEKHYHHTAFLLAAIVSLYYLFVLKTLDGNPAGSSIAESFGEYISFIFLLGSLFTVSGGILIHVRRKATPAVNTALLLTGACLANVFGTTGAAMLLIRPYLRINKGHIKPFHIIFFIFVIANVGGSLTPIGDPPLFLGYLKGVPFWWVLNHCWPMWLTAVGILLAVFFVWDTLAHKNEARAQPAEDDLGPAVSIFGLGNLLLVGCILAGVLLHEDLHRKLALPWRELIMVAAVAVSLWTTPHRIHLENVFNFAPIKEVAFLFIGIFATMVPALNYLSKHANDEAFQKYLSTPGQFYYSSGALSSVLDNAPTYVTFFKTELGKLDPDQIDFVKSLAKYEIHLPTAADFASYFHEHPNMKPAEREQFKRDVPAILATLDQFHHENVVAGNLTDEQTEIGFLLGKEKLNWYIVAISLGSVFFGAMTYIGNGPNFMVKSIAENSDVKCPSFFGYIFKYSLPILLPILILIWLLYLYNPI